MRNGAERSGKAGKEDAGEARVAEQVRSAGERCARARGAGRGAGAGGRARGAQGPGRASPRGCRLSLWRWRWQWQWRRRRRESGSGGGSGGDCGSRAAGRRGEGGCLGEAPIGPGGRM